MSAERKPQRELKQKIVKSGGESPVSAVFASESIVDPTGSPTLLKFNTLVVNPAPREGSS